MKILSFAIFGIVAVTAFSSSNYASAQYGCSPIFGGWHPPIATYEDNVYVAWNYFQGCGQRVLLLRHSPDEGKTFESPVVLANMSQSGSKPTILASGSNVYVAWADYMTNPWKLLFRMSTDYGETFGNAVSISLNDTGEDKATGLIAEGDIVGVVWNGYVTGSNTSQVFLSEVSPNGNSVTTTVLSQGAGNSFASQVVQENGRAYVLWVSYGSCNPGNRHCTVTSYVTTIYLAGNSVTQAVRLDNYANRIAVSGSNVYVAGIVPHEYEAWKTENGVKTYLQTLGNRTIVFAKSLDGGKTFDSPEDLGTFDDSTDGIDNLALDAAQDYVYVAWVDSSKPWSSSIMMMASGNDGNSFGKIMALVGPGAYLNGPEPLALQQQVAASGTRYYAIWQQMPQTLFFRKSHDGGGSLDNATNLQDAMQISNLGCFLASNGDSVYIAGPGHGSDIVFTRSSDGGNSFSSPEDLDRNNAFTVPEFPLAIPVLLAGMATLVVFYRARFVK